jgi:hypothetical protein
MAATVRAPFPAGTAGDIVAASTTITTSVTLLTGDDLELHTGYDKASDAGVTLAAKLDPAGANLSPDGSSIIVHANGATVGFEQVFWWLNASLSAAGLLGAGAKNVTVTASTSADSMEQKAYALTGADHNAPTVTTATGSSGTAAVTSASCPTGGLAIGHFVGGSTFTATNNTTTVLQSGTTGNAGWNIAGNTAAGTGTTISLTGTLPADFWAAIATVWLQAGSAPAAPPPPGAQRWPAQLIGPWPLQQQPQSGVFVPPGTNAPADVAQATGTAYFDTTGGSISLNLIADTPVTATGTAYDATISTAPHTNASAQVATATGTANNPQSQVAPAAALATAVGIASNPTGQVKPVPTAATATGTANGTVSLISPTSSAATATAVANAPTPSVAPGVTAVTATGAAFNATVSTGSFVNVNAGTATATGTANGPIPNVGPIAQIAAGSGTANNPAVSVAASPGTAAGTAAGFGPSPNSSAGTQPATGAGSAFNATVQTGSFVNANAQVAAATGVANGAAAKVGTSPTTAAATATASNAATTSAIYAIAGLASASAVTNNASITKAVSASAAAAVATAAAFAPKLAVLVPAGAASGLGTAYIAVISGAETNAQSASTVTGLTGTAMVTARRTSTSTVTD